MKMTLMSSGLALLLLVASCQQADFVDTEGHEYAYADMADRWLIVNYWATWCGPCIKEIPELNHLAAQHADKLAVFGVNFDDPDPARMRQDIQKMGIAFPVYAVDPHTFFKVERPIVLPTTFIIAPDGSATRTLVGPQTEDTLLAAIGVAGT